MALYRWVRRVTISCIARQNLHYLLKKFQDYAKKLHKQIGDLVVEVRSPLSKNDRAKFNSVLIIDVHARDIIDR